MEVQLPASVHAGHIAGTPRQELPRAKLGAALRSGAGDNDAQVVLPGAEDDLLPNNDWAADSGERRRCGAAEWVWRRGPGILRQRGTGVRQSAADHRDAAGRTNRAAADH